MLRGKVLEAESGKPLAGSYIQFFTQTRKSEALTGSNSMTASEADGSFAIAVPAGKGHLLIHGPTSDYVLQEVGGNVLNYGRPGGARYYAHGVIPFDVSLDRPAPEITAALKPGKTVTGRVVGPDGGPLDRDDVRLLTTLNVQPFHGLWRGDLALHATDGRFILRGLDPDGTPAKVNFLAATRGFGKSLMVSANDAGTDLVVKLEPCGKAKLRLVNRDGKPVGRQYPRLELVAKPGPPDHYPERLDGKLAASATEIINCDRHDRTQSPGVPLTDAGGRITFPNLIPGASYRIIDLFPDADEFVRKEFQVKAGETLDLGDVLFGN